MYSIVKRRESVLTTLRTGPVRNNQTAFKITLKFYLNPVVNYKMLDIYIPLVTKKTPVESFSLPEINRL